MNCYLPNHLPIQFRFWCNQDDFLIISPATATENYVVDIQEFSLQLCGLQVTPTVISRLETMLAKKMATFHYQKTEFKSFTVPKGQLTYSINNLFGGDLPFETLVCMVKTSAYIGDKTLNPYKFDHFDLKEASMYIQNCQEINYNVSFAAGSEDFVTPYRNLYTTDSGTKFTPGIIGLQEFEGGYMVLRFRLSTAQTIRKNRVQQGTGRLTFKWGTALPDSVTILVYVSSIQNFI